MRQDSPFRGHKVHLNSSSKEVAESALLPNTIDSLVDNHGNGQLTRPVVYKRPLSAPVVTVEPAPPRMENKGNVEKAIDENALVNSPEAKSFIATALAWQGSVTPKVLPRVAITALYAAAVYAVSTFALTISVPITPFEYSGAVLALILVLRVNAGHERWWEARKIWGSIVNQSRNLALVVYGYNETKDETVVTGLKWIAAWPHVMRESLRKENALIEVADLVGRHEVDRLRSSENMSMYVALKIAGILTELRKKSGDSFAFLRAETERSQLMDAIGACERIRNTRMPLVLAIKTRRFIGLFLLLLPLALVDRAGWLTPLVVALASYPLFSLDEIGAELQNPFSPRNLSHLPLDGICRTIAGNVMGLIGKGS